MQVAISMTKPKWRDVDESKLWQWKQADLRKSQKNEKSLSEEPSQVNDEEIKNARHSA